MSVLATPVNMRKYQDVRGLIAYSPVTGEEYSANAGDYWNWAPDQVMKDQRGNGMILVWRSITLVDADEVITSIETERRNDV